MASSVRPVVALPDAEPVSFEALYEAHRHSVFSWARRYCGGDASEAEDLTHEVFIKLLAALPQIDAPRAASWLFRVTANLAISRGRARRAFMSRLNALFREGGRVSHPVAVLEARDQIAQVLDELRRLPARERVVVCMRVLDGMNQHDIADTLSLSQGYVCKLLARAIGRL